MHFLISGGLGFIGSHLVERLLGENHTLTIVDNLSSGKRENVPSDGRIELIVRNILDVTAADLRSPVDGVAHLAAVPSVPSSWDNLRSIHDSNLTATLHVMELCGELKIPRLVFASSAAVYGESGNSPIDEEHATQPSSPYGLQKLASEGYGRLLSARLGWAFIALRLFNVYGARQSADSPYSGVISKFAAAAQAKKRPTIYGDGSQTRDFVSVMDVAAAFHNSLTFDFARGETMICNIGTGQPVSIRGLAKSIVSLFSMPSEFDHTPLPTGDIAYSCADISLARQRLNYQPATPLEKGLAFLTKQPVAVN